MSVDDAIEAAEQILPGVAAPDGEVDLRWQAIIAIGDFVETDPEPIWQFVECWGCCADEDLRAAVATCLLEHLLEHHFELIFPRVEGLAGRDRHFLDTFKGCSKFGQSTWPANAKRFDWLQSV